MPALSAKIQVQASGGALLHVRVAQHGLGAVTVQREDECPFESFRRAVGVIWPGGSIQRSADSLLGKA